MTLYAPDRALLRDVFRHARKNGWSRVRDKDTVATWWDYDGGSAIQLERFGRDLVLDINGMTRIDVISLKYAVDVLVAVGLLPAEMSSQYQAGRASVGELTVEWGARHHGTVNTKPEWTEERARDWAAPVAGYPQLDVVRRTVTPWQVVP